MSIQVKKDLNHLNPTLRGIIKTQLIPEILANPIKFSSKIQV